MNPENCPTCHTPVPADAPGGFCPACLLRDAEEPAPGGHGLPPLEEIAAAFPRLEIVRLIGQGGMGFVYEARQPNLDRSVALKVLAPERGQDPAFAERFAREARVLGKLCHPNIVTVFEHGQSAGFFYLLMEYVDGVNLRQAMQAGRFTPEQALAVVPEICDALQAAHAQGIWHRDIKPENILLDRDGRVKIADFGIARIVGDPLRDFTLTRTGGVLGSVAYMAPEQHENPRDIDHRADIYSLGVVIYEMLTGELPLGRFPSPSQRAAVDARMDSIVLRTLEKERELRQQSAAEVKTDVLGAATPIPKIAAKGPAENDLHGKLALGLFLTGILGLLALPKTVVLPGSAGYLPAEILWAAAFFLAFVFGLFGWRGRLGKRVVIGMGVFAVAGVMVTQYTHSRERRAANVTRQDAADRSELEAEAVRLWDRWRATFPMDPDRTYVLCPVMERVLPLPGPGIACMLRLKTGTLHAPDDLLAAQLERGGIRYGLPESSRNRVQEALERDRWLQQVNAVANLPGGDGILLFSTQSFPLAGENLETISQEEIVNSVVAGLERADLHQAFIRSFSRREFIQVAVPQGKLFSFVAPSESGATLGVMQVLGQTADRRGVRIRYRLVGWYTKVVESTVVQRTVIQNASDRWEIIDAGSGDRGPEVIELHGQPKAEPTSGGNYTAATVHVGGQPLFMIAGEGSMGGYFTSQSIGSGLTGNLGPIKFSLIDANQAILENRSYDLSRGRTFLVQKDGTLRQIAKRPEKVLSGDALKNFLADLAAEPPPGSPTLEQRMEGLEAHMASQGPRAKSQEAADPDAWRKKLPEEVRVKFSESDMSNLLGELGWLAPNQVKSGGKPAKVSVWGNDFSNFDNDSTHDWVIQVNSFNSQGKPISGTLIYDLTEHGWTCVAKVQGTFPVGWNHEFEGRKGFYTQESILEEPPIHTRERYFRWDGNRYIEDRVEYARGG